MNSPRPGSSHLGERLELLRVRAAGHRLELTLAAQDLREQSKGLRRGAEIALSVLRLLVPSHARAAPSVLATVLRNALWIIPTASALIFKSRSERRTGGLRAALSVVAVGTVLVRLLRGIWRHREQDGR